MSSLGKLVKQATRIQRQMEAVQEQLAGLTVEASSGGGVVKAVAKCNGTLSSIKIDPQVINPSEPQLLEDLVLAAVNAALEKASEVSKAEMAKVTGGLPFPGLM
ncbi:MAG TPA: YbaB/EbfC family nucleoid-associated protein [Verrucomicrobiota bacterium]|nr:YbaB/EbfC family nucleoid-associated protein [Verrucomicrobiota bacterium]HOK78966.1 YbaB/EbfC family nucleoid-associated protein [Verrucomicrobiota bacterium]